jgi:ribose transport system permease protein
MQRQSDRLDISSERSSYIGQVMDVKNYRVRDWGAILALIFLMAFFTAAGSNFASLNNLQALVESSAIPVIAVIGITFVMLQGSIDLSVEGVASLACIVTSLFVANSVTSSHNLGLALVVALGSGLLLGLINGLMYSKLKIPSLIVTLGMWFVARGAATYLFPSRQPQILDPMLMSVALDKHFGLSGIVYVAIVLLIIAYFIQSKTRIGRLSYGIGGDEALCRLAGLRVDRIKIAVFVMSGFLSSLCGVLLTAQLGVGNPRGGDGLLFPSISAAVIGGTLLSGGKGGVFQSVVGVLILSVIRNGLQQIGVDPLLTQVVEGATIVVAVVAGSWHMRTKLRVAK